MVLVNTLSLLQFSTEGHRALFYVEDASTANALAKVSRKITDTEGYKVLFIPHTHTMHDTHVQMTIT